MKKIQLTNCHNHTLVDDEDYPVLSRLNWYLSDTGYAVTDSPVKHIKMHKLIIGPVGKKVIDHIDRNKLNNQKDNLRVVSQSTNVKNSDRYENSKHFYYDNVRGHWIVDSKSLGVRYLRVPNTSVAHRVVKRLKLGFPKDKALSEAEQQTISISNWKQFGITYNEYLDAKSRKISIKELRRSRRGKTSA